jgi:hypothetical protein
VSDEQTEHDVIEIPEIIEDDVDEADTTPDEFDVEVVEEEPVEEEAEG